MRSPGPRGGSGVSTAEPGGEPGRILRAAVRASLADLDDDAAVGVAVSGGADSLALARAAAAVRTGVVACVVDHGLQPGSAAIAARAARACCSPEGGIGLVDAEVVAVSVPTGPGHGGPEAAARDSRRAALTEWARRRSLAAVLLGHTREDQAETVLLRLARGSGARALAAMAPVEGLWRRPLLDIPRAVVRSTVADLPVWEDPHNADPAYARVRVREDALPALAAALGPDVVSGLVRTAALLRDDADALDGLAEEALARARLVGDPDAAVALDVAVLAAAPRAVRTRVLRRAAVAAGCPAGSLTRDHVLALEALVTDWHGQGPIALPGTVGARRRYARLLLNPTP